MNQMSQRGTADKMIPDDVESASLLGRPIEEHKKKRKIHKGKRAHQTMIDLLSTFCVLILWGLVLFEALTYFNVIHLPHIVKPILAICMIPVLLLICLLCCLRYA